MAQTNSPHGAFRTAVIHVWDGNDTAWVLEREPGDVQVIPSEESDPLGVLRDSGHLELAEHLAAVGYLTMPVSSDQFPGMRKGTAR